MNREVNNMNCQHNKGVVTNYYGDGYYCIECDEWLTNKQLRKIEISNLDTEDRKLMLIEYMHSVAYPQLYSEEQTKKVKRNFKIISSLIA